VQEERDKLDIEFSNHQNLQHSVEQNKEGLQRLCAELEQDKAYLQQQLNDLKMESSSLR
jgi:hypothetical protein